MKLGLGLPQRTGFDLRQDVINVAKAAEENGFASVWVFERLLFPTEPTQGLYGYPGLDWPEAYQSVAEPLVVLTAAAAVTERVRLGTSVLVAPMYRPVQLAKSLATLDQISGGRLIAGLGTGWSEDEFAAVGVPLSGRGRELDQALDVFEAAWGPDPVSFEGRGIRLDKAIFGPKPVSKIPVMFGGGTAKVTERVARRGDGWLPTAMPVKVTADMWNQLREKAEGYGRDASALELIVRANVVLTDQPVAGERMPFMGSLDQVVEDFVETARLGADEVLVDLQGQHPFPGVNWVLDTALEIKRQVDAAGV
ncbi:LLM class F420-dependent oxidoreductase [Pseudonocardia xinjiangensis]|uniref:LLM class F420-dependent oxidoreductase n=1 Tax=Pseudonocardia xinjiangensis TaxID=75289 RepID=UPI003D94066D